LLSLRYPWLWAIAGWLLVLAVVAGSLLPGPSLPTVAVGDKIQHAGAYCLLMVWFGGLYERRRHGVIALGLVALGVALDLLQLTTRTRTFDVADVVANSVGVLLGLCLSMAVLGGWCQKFERLIWAPNA
jgi:VanZ family protein